MPSNIEQADPPSDPPKEVDPPEAHYDLKDPAGLAGFLIDSDIKLVRAEYLMSLLDADGRFPRRQEAETTTFTDAAGASRSALVSHEEVQAWADEPKRAVICSISHAWEAREHPDPCGHQLLQVVHHTSLYVAAYFAEIWVFFDYVSLFQYLRESDAQQASFGLAMENMHVMYSHEMSVTLRVESLTPAERWAKALHDDEMITVFHAASKVVKRVLIKDLVHNPTPYANRGWCIGEMEWSSDRQATAQNQLIDIRDSDGQEGGLKLLGRVPTAPEHFEVKMETAAFTHRSDAKAVVHLQEKIFVEKVRRNESLNLEGLPRSEFQRLLHALPYFEVLQSITLVHFECSQEEAEALAKALRETKVLKFQCRCNEDYQESFNHMIQALVAVLNETCIAELNFRKDYFDDARMDFATVEVLAKALETNSHVTHLNLESSQIKNEGIKALAEMLKINRTMKDLNLERCLIGVEGIKALATALKLNDTVVDINLADNWQCGIEGAEAMAAVLSTNAAIKRLNLEECKIGDAGVEALASALRINRVLTHLRLHRNDVGVQGAQALATALKSNKTVVDINLAQNFCSCGDEAAEALAGMLTTNRTITRLNLERCFIGVEGIKALATALKLNDTVVDINLADNRWLGDEGAEAMAAVLSTNAAIKRLNLEECKIGDAGVEALASALRINRALTQLRLHGNDVGVQGAQALASALMVNRVVAADWNQDDTSSANQLCRSPFGASTRLQALADALRINQTITLAHLRNSKIGDDDLKALADALSINKTITRLHLDTNQIGDNGMKALANALRVNRTIQRLALFCNPIGDEGVKALAAALEANKTITKVSLSDFLLTDEGKQAYERIKAICRENEEREREKARAEREMQESP